MFQEQKEDPCGRKSINKGQEKGGRNDSLRGKRGPDHEGSQRPCEYVSFLLHVRWEIIWRELLSREVI